MSNVVSNLSQLVRFKTLSYHHKENASLLQWIRSRVRLYPVHSRMFWSGGYPSLLITTQRTKKPILWLCSHIDVVAGNPKLFHPRVKGGRVYGRGTYDMKFAAACYLRLLDELKDDIKKYNFGVMLTSDEEVDGDHGVGFFLKSGYASKICFLPDGGYDWKVEEGAKGLWEITLESRGFAAHPSTPWAGKSALHDIVDFLSRLKTVFPSEPCGDSEHRHSSYNIDSIRQQSYESRVSDNAAVSVDIFFPSEKEFGRVSKKIHTLLSRFPQIRIRDSEKMDSYRNPVNHPYVNQFYAIANAYYGIHKKTVLSHSTSDARYFRKKNIPVIGTRPKGGGHHGDSEWIDIADLNRFYRVLKAFVLTST